MVLSVGVDQTALVVTLHFLHITNMNLPCTMAKLRRPFFRKDREDPSDVYVGTRKQFSTRYKNI